MDASGSVYVSELVDVAELPLDALDDLPDTALVAVLRDMGNPADEPFAAFTSALL